LILAIESYPVDSGNLPNPGFFLPATPGTPFTTGVLLPGDVLNVIMLIPYPVWSIQPFVNVTFDYVAVGSVIGPTGPPMTINTLEFPSTGPFGQLLTPTTATKYYLDSFESNVPTAFLVTAQIATIFQTPAVPQPGDFIAYGLTDDVTFTLKKNLNLYPLLLSNNSNTMNDHIDVLIPKNSPNTMRFFVEALVSGSNDIFIEKFDYTARAIG
jgi:hypothetical protein